MTPITVFVCTTVAWLLVLTLVIRSYQDANNKLHQQVHFMDVQLQRQGAFNQLEQEQRIDLQRRIIELERGVAAVEHQVEGLHIQTERSLEQHKMLDDVGRALKTPARPTSFERILDDNNE